MGLGTEYRRSCRKVLGKAKKPWIEACGTACDGCRDKIDAYSIAQGVFRDRFYVPLLVFAEPFRVECACNSKCFSWEDAYNKLPIDFRDNFPRTGECTVDIGAIIDYIVWGFKLAERKWVEALHEAITDSSYNAIEYCGVLHDSLILQSMISASRAVAKRTAELKKCLSVGEPVPAEIFSNTLTSWQQEVARWGEAFSNTDFSD